MKRHKNAFVSIHSPFNAKKCFALGYTANVCIGNTMKSFIFEIFLSIRTAVCMVHIKKYFQKYNWKYHLSTVLGAVIKCPKGTGSAWETLRHEKLHFWSQYICNKEEFKNLSFCKLQYIQIPDWSPISQYTWHESTIGWTWSEQITTKF